MPISLFGRAAVLAVWLASAGAALAHNGEDHGAAPAAPSLSPAPVAPLAAPAVAAESHLFQLVARAVPGETRTLFYLADADSNAPLAGANITVLLPDSPQPAQEIGAGTYAVGWLPSLNPVDLTVLVQHGPQEDLLLLPGVALPPPPAHAEPPVAHWTHWSGGAILGGLAVMMVLWLRRRDRHALSLLLCAFSLLAAAPALAHGGEDHSHGDTPAAAAPESGAMLTMDKATQFLLGIRTQPVRAQEAADSVRVVGRVVPDPAGYARLPPSQLSRVVADAQVPLPVPGQRVSRGQVLAVLEPALTGLEKGDRRAALTRIDSELAIQEREVPRMQALASAIPFRTVETARIRLEQLRRERAQIAATVLGRELVVAPVDGLVSDVHLVPGDVVTPDRPLVEILDPSRLRVEAVLHDLSLDGKISGAVAGAKTLGDQLLPLTLLGISPRLDGQDMGVHALFQVDPAHTTGLKVGMPLDVHLSTGATRLRTAVPRDAIVERGGRQVVFIRTAPEQFEARPVVVHRSVGPLVDVHGVQDGERVVIQGMDSLKAAR